MVASIWLPAYRDGVTVRVTARLAPRLTSMYSHCICWRQALLFIRRVWCRRNKVGSLACQTTITSTTTQEKHCDVIIVIISSSRSSFLLAIVVVNFMIPHKIMPRKWRNAKRIFNWRMTWVVLSYVRYGFCFDLINKHNICACVTNATRRRHGRTLVR